VLLAPDPAEGHIACADDTVANTPEGASRIVCDGDSARPEVFKTQTIGGLGRSRERHKGNNGHGSRKGQTLGH